jgi:hypothetical protein
MSCFPFSGTTASLKPFRQGAVHASAQTHCQAAQKSQPEFQRGAAFLNYVELASVHEPNAQHFCRPGSREVELSGRKLS